MSDTSSLKQLHLTLPSPSLEQEGVPPLLKGVRGISIQSLQQFARYEAYQDSGVEWLGEIPQGWKISKLMTLLKPTSTKNHSDIPLLSITREKGVILRDLDSDENHNFIPDDLSTYKLLKKGQFGMNKMKAWQGSYGVSKFTGIVSPAYYTFDLLSDINPNFFHIAIRTKLYVSFFGRASDGVRIGQWDLSKDRMKLIPFAIPPLAEQTTIAHFLDQKTAEIDQAIALKTDLIERLKEYKQITVQHAVTRGLDPNAKMKASGVEWIGDIPESWEVKKLKCGVTIQGGFAFQSVDFVDSGVQLLKIANLYMNDLCLDRQPTFLNISFLRSHKDWIVGNGDILMSLTGTLGKRDYGFAILLNGKSRFLLNQRVARLRVSKLFQKKFLLSLLQSENYLSQLYSLPAGTKQANLSNEDVVNIKVPVPSLEEQAAIVAHIEAISAKIDQATDQAQQQINTLAEYKTVLINAAVTGKIKVTDDSAQGTRHAQ